MSGLGKGHLSWWIISNPNKHGTMQQGAYLPGYQMGPMLLGKAFDPGTVLANYTHGQFTVMNVEIKSGRIFQLLFSDNTGMFYKLYSGRNLRAVRKLNALRRTKTFPGRVQEEFIG